MDTATISNVGDLPPCLEPDHTWLSMPASMFIFDLDDTLAPSKSPLPVEIASGIADLLTRAQVCIISGGQFDQFDKQVIRQLVLSPDASQRLHLMPTCGTRYYTSDGEVWNEIYAEELGRADRARVADVLLAGALELGLLEAHTWGEVIEDRGSQVTFSALGQSAPVSAKAAWDPTGQKKSALRAYAQARLPQLEVRSGGSTSVDVTRVGIDKAYGVRKLLELTNTSVDECIFVGDRLDPDGNDFPVRGLGIPCVAVHEWQQTAELLDRWILLPDRAPVSATSV